MICREPQVLTMSQDDATDDTMPSSGAVSSLTNCKRPNALLDHAWEKLMKLPHRRQFLHLAAGAAVLPAASRVAWAQGYPTKPVRCLIAYAPGGGTDIFVRLVSQSLPSLLGQPFILENRPGAASNIATEMVTRAPADGYTLLGTDSAAAINVTLYSNLGFNFVRDITMVAMARGPLVLAVHPSVPARTVPELIVYAKKHPGKISFGSSGVGSSLQMAGELFKFMAGVELVHVPYRGAAPALTDFLGGQVQLMFIGLPPSGEHIRAGRLRALAVTTTSRWKTLPDVPPLADFVPGYETDQWWGIGVRRSTSAGIIEKLNNDMNTILADSQVQARVADLGGAVFPGSPSDLDRFIAADTEKWGKVVRLSGVKPE
jgi:tripartite-type tricarboxylate transporter receptor subunit TctC